VAGGGVERQPRRRSAEDDAQERPRLELRVRRRQVRVRHELRHDAVLRGTEERRGSAQGREQRDQRPSAGRAERERDGRRGEQHDLDALERDEQRPLAHAVGDRTRHDRHEQQGQRERDERDGHLALRGRGAGVLGRRHGGGDRPDGQQHDDQLERAAVEDGRELPGEQARETGPRGRAAVSARRCARVVGHVRGLYRPDGGARATARAVPA
jgi:hypothetical protein